MRAYPYLLFLLLLVLFSCDGNPVDNDPVHISAAFRAVSLNGEPIPEPSEPGKCEVVFRVVNFNSDGFFSHELRLESSVEEPACITSAWPGSGAYEITRDSIHATFQRYGYTWGLNDAEWIEYLQSFREVNRAGTAEIQPNPGVWVFERVPCDENYPRGCPE